MITIRSKIQKKLLNLFFLNEGKRYYVNELARLIGEEAKNVLRILLRLEGSGMLHSEYAGKERFFFVNTKVSGYREYKKLFLRTAGVEASIKEILVKLPGIREAYIFGSYAKNTMDANSDIDLLIIGGHKALEAEKLLHGLKGSTGREINSVNISPEELEKRKKENDQFIRTVFGGKTIKLI